MRLLYLCDATHGGIAEYAIHQSRALSEAGANVSFLCRSGFEIHRLKDVTALPQLSPFGRRHPSRWLRAIDRIIDARRIAKAAVQIASVEKSDALLIACYAEYFSPLWASIYRKAARRGLRIVTIAHDPIRDLIIGPQWWHKWSVRQGYSFVRDVFVHDAPWVDFGGPTPPGLRVHSIPHGPYSVPHPCVGRVQTRKKLGLHPADQVFLSFGQIRDGKNLDRFLRAMVKLPQSVKLLVAGTTAGESVRQPEDYKDLARELGVADRCVWEIRYVPEEETGDLFDAVDFVLMTYSSRFHSASGVLNTAVACRKPILASSGEGPLKSSLIKYGLGIFVAPDDDDAVLMGARSLISSPIMPNWLFYEHENSWPENARKVIEAISESIPVTPLHNEKRPHRGGAQK